MISRTCKETAGTILGFTRQKCMEPDDQKWLVTVDEYPDWYSYSAIKGRRPNLHAQNTRLETTVASVAKIERDPMASYNENQTGGFIDCLTRREEKSILFLWAALNQVNTLNHWLQNQNFLVKWKIQ